MGTLHPDPGFLHFERGYASLRAGRSAEAVGQLMGGLGLVALIVIFLFDLPFPSTSVTSSTGKQHYVRPVGKRLCRMGRTCIRSDPKGG